MGGGLRTPQPGVLDFAREVPGHGDHRGVAPAELEVGEPVPDRLLTSRWIRCSPRWPATARSSCAGTPTREARRAGLDERRPRPGGWTSPGSPDAAERHRARGRRGPSAARAKARNGSSAAGSAIAPVLAALSRATPSSSRLTGTSHFLPFRVRGTSATGRSRSGTCRGDSSVRSSRGCARSRRRASPRRGTTNSSSCPAPAAEVSTTSESASRQLLHHPVELGGAHPHPAAVERGVRPPVDHARPAGGDLDPVAVPPDARVLGEVGLAQAGPVLVTPEETGIDGIGAVITSSPTSSITGRPSAVEGLDLRTQGRGTGSRPRTPAAVGAPPTKPVHTSVPPVTEARAGVRPTSS